MHVVLFAGSIVERSQRLHIAGDTESDLIILRLLLAQAGKNTKRPLGILAEDKNPAVQGSAAN